MENKLTVNNNDLVTVQDMERALIVQHLEYFKGNKTKAASSLGITVKTLYNKLHEYGLFETYCKPTVISQVKEEQN